MAEKGGTRILAIITICIVLISILFSGCFNNVDHGPNSFEYNLTINSNETGKYQLFVPVAFNHLINSSEMKNTFFSNIRIIEGNPDYSYIYTKYGFALNVTGSGNITLKSSKTGGEIHGMFLSMDTNQSNFRGWNRTHWIYLKSSEVENITINIAYIGRSDTGGGSSEETRPQYQIIYNGWQEISTHRTIWKS